MLVIYLHYACKLRLSKAFDAHTKQNNYNALLDISFATHSKFALIYKHYLMASDMITQIIFIGTNKDTVI